MNVLVTGAAGVLGRHVVPNLRHAGYQVIASGKGVGDRVDVVWDIADQDAPEPDCDAEVVIHLAAAIGRYRQPLHEAGALFNVNVTGALRVVRWCRSRRVRRLLVASSAIVYGDWTGSPKSEKDPVSPWSAGPYAVSKWCGEQVALLMGHADLEVVILRLASLYGAGYNDGLVCRMLRQGRQTGHVLLRPPVDDGFDLLHVSDAACAVQRAIELGDGVYNIGGGQLTLARDLARICASTVRAKVVVTDEPASRPSRIINWLDDTKARKELQHRNLVSLDAGMTEMAEAL
jgi:nucleoside-diphosphate-sugar epimerase